MGQQIEQDLESRGVAQVVVVLKPHARPPAGAAVTGLSGTVSAANAGPELSQIGACFIEDEHSQTSQLLKAAQSGRSVRSSHRVKRAKPAAAELETPPIARYYPNLGVMLGNVQSSGLKTLRQHKDVDAVLGAPMWGLIRPVAATSLGKPKNGTAWGLSAMKIPALWKKGLTGKGVVIGHLDTGLDAKHSALKKALIAFAEFDDLGRQVPKAKPFDGDPGSPTRPRGHGTHTAATLAGRPVGKMKVGVAPGAMLASAIVIEGGDTVARILGGMDWAVSQGVRILSMSVGLPGWFDEFRTIMKLLRARGVLPIFASGNEGPGTSRSPGNYTECLSVGAFDRHHVMASFSSSQRFNRNVDPIVPDLAGPGVEIWSAKPGGGYQGMSGTSMATPHVAGLAALLMEAEPTKTIDQIEKAIRRSCSPNSLPAERAGNGAPNAVTALSLL